MRLYVLCSPNTFAFFVGRLVKGPKLAPKISPNKTISGAVGGLIFGAIASMLIYLIFNSFSEYHTLFETLNLNIFHTLMIGINASIFNQIGDLYESHKKRQLGIKDFGNLFPGHGGIMDRVDGLSFVSLVLLIIYAIAL